MRGVETRIQEIRHRVFREVARMAYHTEWPVDKRIESLPYKIIPGEVGNFRNDVFLERAIVGERLRLAMGLPCRSAAEHAPLSENIEAADRPETYYTPPLINVIKFACNGCAEKRVLVTEGCQGCLAHPCEEVCPKDAIQCLYDEAPSILNYKIAEYTKAVVDGRPCFHVSLVMDVSPNCDCHGENDVPIVPNVGMFASFDPVALDQACIDAVLAQPKMPNSAIGSGEACQCEDHFKAAHPDTDWEAALIHSEKIGLGSRKYELVKI